MNRRDFPDVDVIIVGNGSADQLQRAVASVEAQADPGRVWVVTYAATDAAEAVRAAHAGVRVVPASSGGCAAAVNAGLEATSGDVLLLHTDAEIQEHCLRALVARMRSNRTAAMVAPCVTDAEGTLQAESFGQFPTFWRAIITQLNRFAHRISGGVAKSRGEFSATTPVDWTTAACVLVRRTAIEKAGPMNPAFGGSYFDIEWCHRMRGAGYTVLIEPLASCLWHGPTGHAGADAHDDLMTYCRATGTGSLLVAAQLGARVPQLLLGC